MEHLTISHLQHYLAYGLRVQYKNEIKKVVGLNVDYHPTIEVRIDDDVARYASIHIAQTKPLLLPLSALYEEIDGEIGIVELAKIAGLNNVDIGKRICFKPCAIAHPNYDGFAYYFWWDEFERCFVMGNSHHPIGGCVIKNQLALFDYLFSHHYDVYSLIDNGLGIDKRSVK